MGGKDVAERLVKMLEEETKRARQTLERLKRVRQKRRKFKQVAK